MLLEEIIQYQEMAEKLSDRSLAEIILKLCDELVWQQQIERAPVQTNFLIGPWRDRLYKIFNRRSSTALNRKEEKAFNDIMPLDETELAMVERYYKANRYRKNNICRRTLIRLLNNWNGEVDRARQWCMDHPLPAARKIVAPKPPERRPSREEYEATAEKGRLILRQFREQMRNPDPK